MSYVTTIEFLQGVYPDPVRPGRLMMRTRSRRNGARRSHWLHTLGEAAAKAHRRRTSREVFFSVPLHDVDEAVRLTRERWPGIKEPSARPSEGSAVALPALWAEVEVAGAAGGDGAAGERILPPDRDATFALLEAVEVPPSIIVEDGHRYQAYWVLDELWIFENPDDRGRAADLLRRLQGMLHFAARARGWWVDDDAGLARLLRLPDTFRLDGPDHTCATVVHFPRFRTLGAGAAGDHRYRLSDFQGLPEAPRIHARELLLRGASATPGIAPTFDLEPILEGCSWLAHWIRNAWRLRGADYQDVVAIAVRAVLGGTGSRGLVHGFSRQHPGYNPVRTEEQIALALLTDPPACQRISGRALEQHCRRCPHFGRIEMPLDLGRVHRAKSVVAPTAYGKQDSRSIGREGITTAVEDGPAGGDEGPASIPVTTREHEVHERTLAALAAREAHLFTRGGALVEVIAAREPGPIGLDRAPDPPVVRPIRQARLRELVARHCVFETATLGSGPKTVRPPRWVVRALLDRGAWPELPALAGVVECPVLRPDGSVLQRPGHDAESGLFYAPSGDFRPVPEAPGQDEAHASLAQLREAVSDFPFGADADFAAWLCALLTPLARAAVTGPVPLFLIDGNLRGCGKSLLADVCAVLLDGRSAPRTTLPGREAELRQTITSLALGAERTVLLDNVTGALGSPALDRALTAETWRDRMVGSSRQVALPLQITWVATGNHVALAGDTSRRCLRIRLHSPLERPESRDDFRHPRLLDWLRRERSRLLPAALTLLRAYAVAGRPRQPIEAWGSFESWSDWVRSTVVWLGLPDPALTREGAHAGGETALHALVFGLAELLEDLDGAATARQIVDRLAAEPGAYARLRSALAELIPKATSDRGELPSPIRLAGRLRAYRGRVVRGACIDLAPRHHAGNRWTVIKKGEIDVG